MRYFLITFNPNNVLAFGMILLECEDFFSYDLLLEEVQKASPQIESVVIIAIFEFRTKADYLAYKAEKKIE